MINHIRTNQHVSIWQFEFAKLFSREDLTTVPVYQEPFTSTISFLNPLTAYIKM